jgi:uncharacterized membrane protein
MKLRSKPSAIMSSMRLKQQLVRFTQAHWLFALIAIIFGGIFVLIVPPLWGQDEPSHFERVYQIAHGQIFPDRASKASFGGEAPSNLVDLGNYAIGDLVDNTTVGLMSRKDIRDINGYKQFTNAKFSKTEKPTPNSASYSPVAYIGPVIAVLLADTINANIGHTLFLARVFSLVAYVLLGWLALRLLRTSKLKWLFMLVLLLPTALFEASVISADGMVIGLSILLTALFIRLVSPVAGQNNRKLFYSLLIVAILLPLVKINYVFLSSLLLFVPNTIFTKRRFTLLLKFIAITFAAVAVLFWNTVTDAGGDAPVTLRPDGLAVSAPHQLSFILNHPLSFPGDLIRTFFEFGDSYIRSAISLVGWNYIEGPLLIVILLCAGMAFAGFYAKKESNAIMRAAIPLLALSILGVLSIFGALYLEFTPVGSNYVDGVQGRYLLPFFVPVIITLVAFLPIEVKIKDKAVPYIFASLALISILFSVGMFYLATY